jgi:Mlc titration factor MtfA (ptsG expression regulator)
MNIFRRMKIRYVLHRHPLPFKLWEETLNKLAILQGLTTVEKVRLREFCTLFLHDKKFVTVQGLQLSEGMKLLIAAQACLPVLQIGLDLLDDWSHIIVYPGDFEVEHQEQDDIGVVHLEQRELSGESWERGPVILSWAGIEDDCAYAEDGQNLVIHEIAHKLDMLNGAANGMPPLHVGMDGALWTQAFSDAYRSLRRQTGRNRDTSFDAYAADSPAEFFAVASEYFFAAPDILHTHYPTVYHQLRLYYRQDPLLRGRRPQ